MSGGHYDYIQFKLDEVIRQMEQDYENTDGYIKTTPPLTAIRKTLESLKEARIYIHRLDWLMSGDDGEESFRIRLKEDLERGYI